jgi:ribulose-5-phosphate 4-epimerase/fuculose-1-phosphate aldolase
MNEEIMEQIMDAIPEDLTNGEVAAILATIAAGFSNGKDAHAVMHLHSAAAMVLSKMLDADRTIN